MHDYGPHRPEDQPRTVTVFRSDAAGGDYQAPIPAGILRQREQLNTLAHLAAQLAQRIDCSHAEATARLLTSMGMPITEEDQ